jgi:integrase
LDNFMRFCGLEDYDSITRVSHEELQIKVEDYIINLKKKISPNTIPTFFYPVKAFLESNDIELKWKKILKLFPEKTKKAGREAWANDEIEQMLNCTTNPKTASLIHFLASSGCRIGSIPELRMKHISQIGDNCKCVTLYENSKDEHCSFLTPEASKSLDDYLAKRESDGEIFGPESPVFRTEYNLGNLKARPNSRDSLKQIINRVVRKAGLRGISDKKGKRYSIPLSHGFRKRFITTLKLNQKVPIAVTERLVGHKMYHDEMGNFVELDESYMRATKEQLFKAFELAIPDLTITNEARLKAENEILAKSHDERSEKLGELKENLIMVAEKMAKMENEIEQLKSKEKN